MQHERLEVVVLRVAPFAGRQSSFFIRALPRGRNIRAIFVLVIFCFLSATPRLILWGRGDTFFFGWGGFNTQRRVCRVNTTQSLPRQHNAEPPPPSPAHKYARLLLFRPRKGNAKGIEIRPGPGTWSPGACRGSLSLRARAAENSAARDGSLLLGAYGVEKGDREDGRVLRPVHAPHGP